MKGPIRGLSNVLHQVSPRHRRWNRIVRSLTLDPDELAKPIREPREGSFIICGVPRTGTALLTAMLFQPPRVLTVMEPWDCFRLAPADLFESLRAEAMSGYLGRGRLDIEALRTQHLVRWLPESRISADVDANEQTVLGVKMPAFWRYLELLPNTKFIVCLRDPVEVVTSFMSQPGTLSQGLDYDVPFNQKLNKLLTARYEDVASRRVGLFDEIAERVMPHLARPEVHTVRYEDWATDASSVMQGLSQFLKVELGPATVRIRDSQTVPPQGLKEFVHSRSRTAAALGYGP